MYYTYNGTRSCKHRCQLLCIYTLGPPDIYQGNNRYSSGSEHSLVTLECRSRTSIPTSVTWLRYDETIDTFSDPLYQTMEIADTRQGLGSSYFRSVLNVKSVSGALGRQRYTCILRNTFGSDSEHISLHREGMSTPNSHA